MSHHPSWPGRLSTWTRCSDTGFVEDSGKANRTSPSCPKWQGCRPLPPTLSPFCRRHEHMELSLACCHKADLQPHHSTPHAGALRRGRRQHTRSVPAHTQQAVLEPCLARTTSTWPLSPALRVHSTCLRLRLSGGARVAVPPWTVPVLRAMQPPSSEGRKGATHAGRRPAGRLFWLSHLARSQGKVLRQSTMFKCSSNQRTVATSSQPRTHSQHCPDDARTYVHAVFPKFVLHRCMYVS